MAEQHKIILPPPTEADYRAGVAACIALMTPEGAARTRAYLNTPQAQKAIKWKSPQHPDKTEKQLADEAKNGPRKK